MTPRAESTRPAARVAPARPLTSALLAAARRMLRFREGRATAAEAEARPRGRGRRRGEEAAARTVYSPSAAVNGVSFTALVGCEQAAGGACTCVARAGSRRRGAPTA